MSSKHGTIKFFILNFTVFILFLIPILALAGISTTKHNLSVSGPGPVKAVSETQICIFCHTPHNAYPSSPLWNHDPSSAVSYTSYWSPSLKAYPSQAEAPPIDGFSKLCLGCHDGTVALGAVRTKRGRGGEIRMVTIPGVVESGRLRPKARGHIGTDLSGGHPISFRFDESLKTRRQADPDLMPLRWPITDPDVKLHTTQGGYGVQCTSCHDPHLDRYPGSAPPFWRKPTYDEVCMVCHEP